MKYLLSMILTFWCMDGFAKTVYFGKSELKITVPFTDTDGDLVSEPLTLVFPKEVKAVKNKSLFIIGPEDKGDPDYTRLTIVPMLKSGHQRVSFTMVDGHTIRVHARIIKKKHVFDSEVKFLPRAILDNKNTRKVKLTDLDILRARLANKELLGFETKNINKIVRCGLWNITARLKRVDKSADTKVYQIELSSRSRKYEYHLNLEKIYFKGQDLNRSIIVHTNNHTLSPKKHGGDNKATLTLVTDATTSITQGRICKLNEQLIQVEYQQSKKKKKDKA
ncbi:MAG: hypothetical protein KDD45_00605 [Bdellovibrionales bacterium]|nr:hypothetical protein [Bdellovibrionales bacterium]